MLKFPKPFSLLVLFVALFAVRSSSAQQSEEPASKVPVTTVVTVLGPNFTAPPALGKDDVIVHTGKQREDVTRWAPAQGENGTLDLAILIDDINSPSLANQFSDVRAFIHDQGKDTRIGVFYADNGTARLGANFTLDHDAAPRDFGCPWASVPRP